jgi:aminocarboxymuconate-semialdehyde decarboxylase
LPIIDVHAHVTPERFKEAIAKDGNWYGLGAKVGEIHHGGFAKSLDERFADMEADGIEMQLLSPTIGFYQYGNKLDTTKTVARECNDEVAEMVAAHPDKFAGVGTLPMQDVDAAIAELQRIMGDKGLKGAIIDDHVLGKTYDEPEFLPFYQAADELGAVLFYHQGGDTCVVHRISRYKMGNAIGNLADRTITFAALVHGGVMDKCQNFKPLLGHAGGYTAFGVPRMDKTSGALHPNRASNGEMRPPFGRGEGEYNLQKPPSEYLDRFFYDCCTYDEDTLRFLVNKVGADRVMLGTDYPAPMFLEDPVRWVNGLDSFSDTEKQQILADNATAMLGL